LPISIKAGSLWMECCSCKSVYCKHSWWKW
jgi:hypothetical protein